ncbi:uncharacterized protein CcaverHIS019_0303000 [Cutaneotrichosporon cavernicola]|uniref:Dopey N-terminal domain-containing protein n=1 Tax=Cutaneotrichosporon cavernicola TaxID=279322 RepID=A0AA48L1U5_9TREE|nr:uncharacterized protein CcaverHIS019_0303000 [Cutaneotrichosporon cavernicola]BEI90230.1 hypothetical protein CcaverHIS019_0303000 [Cutaneotrichosporon cavernicola]
MPNPFGMFGSDAGSTPASSSPSRSASPAQTPGTLPPTSLRRPASHGRLAQLMAPGKGRVRSGSTASQEVTTTHITAHADDSTVAGRQTPEQRRRSARAAAASLLASDVRYKKFAYQVDKSLQSFENVNEWADFISFLSRLLKGQSPQYSEIPRKVTVAKRLAQCLNPALPAGVHTRALDVYSQIFSMIGTEGLKRDLLIWSSGLFPFFQNASTSVRPALINIYETYYLPLGEDLRAATKALILALLPGVEEEIGDFFDQVMSLLNRLSDAVSQRFFLQNVFLVLVSSPGSRLAAVNYLARALNEPPVHLVSDSDVGLLIRGVAAVLEDDNMLVRRGGLDLLLRILPIDGAILKDASQGDREHLVRAVSAVVLNRDVSLSRRVYTWFLSADEASEKQVSFFKEHGLNVLATTLEHDMRLLPKANDVADAQSSFKIFLSLLDKWEIGEPLSHRLAVPSLEACRATAAAGHDEEVRGTASAVYEAIEPSVLWRHLYKGVEADMDEGRLTHVKLVFWLLTTLPQQDEETITVHVPLMAARILRGVNETKNGDVLEATLKTLEALLVATPASLFTNVPEKAETSNGPSKSAEELAYLEPLDEEGAAKVVRATVMPEMVSDVFKSSEKALKERWAPSLLLHFVQLTKALIDREVPPLNAVDSKSWSAAVLQCLEKVHSFAVVDVLVDSLLQASRSRLFKPPIDLASDAVMSPVLDALFRYLRPDAAAYHARAVELLWEFNQLAEVHTLESVIARRMSSQTRKSEAFEAFGVLWRQSDDSMLPGEIFHVPMFMILDGLKGDDPQVLRAAETWMRCNLRSYFRMLDPLLRRTLALLAQRSTKATSSDASLMYYFVTSLTSLFRFGGQGLGKACQSMEISKSPNTLFVNRVEETFPEATTYLELLTGLLTRLLESAPNEQLTLRVQSGSLELLQLLVARGDLSTKSQAQVKNALVEKLSEATQHKHLTLQNTMLHLLHAALSQGTDRRRSHRVSSSTFSLPERPSSLDNAAHEFEESMLHMVIAGVSAPGNRPILQHWVDFVLMTIPHLEHDQRQLRALNDCFCEQLRMTMLKLRTTFAISTAGDVPATITESEPIMLIGVIERLATVLGGRAGGRRSEDRDRREHDGGGGLLGYLPTVFSVEAPQDTASKCEAARYLDDIMDCLLVTWTVSDEREAQSGPPSATTASRIQIMSRTRTRARKALEKLFKAQPSELVASSVQVWAVQSSDIEDSAIFDCLDTLAPSAQKVVDLICEHMSGKGRGSIESSNPALPAFLEAYISRLEGPIAIQVWNAQYGYARDILGQSNSPSARMLLFPVLRCLTMLGQIVSTTSALEDRRLRRDLQETYVKVLDAVLSNASRLGDSALWQRGHTLNEGKALSSQGVQKIYLYIGDHVLRNLRTFLVDQDRVSSACASVSSNIIAPAFKQQKVDDIILCLLQELTKIPAAVKSWRPPVGDAFNDNRFFRMPPKEAEQWRPLVCALMDSDKERLSDLLGRIAAAPSANIFTNREAETTSRSLNLRRLSFVLLAAERNHHLAQLPSIQEKLVEILRTNVVSPRVHSEVYLCLRVLMTRISPQHLANFWPVILAELLRVFEATMDEPPPDGSEDLALVLASCKFLDLLLVIQSEDFQIHQWIFVTDTTDAAYPPEHYSPEALVDRLAEILVESATIPKADNAIPVESSDGRPRRPHLAGVRALASLHQLQPFFSRASIDTFEGVYNDAGVDWDAIEDGLNAEIFESN